MKISKKILITLIQVLLLSQIVKTDNPFETIDDDDWSACNIIEKYENTKLFTTVDEVQYYDLNDYIRGFNLTYEIDHNGHEKDVGNIYQINSGHDTVSQHTVDNNDKYHITVGIDHLYENTLSSKSVFAELVSSLDKGDYAVRFGEGFKDLEVNYQTTVPLSMDHAMQCLDVTIVSQTVAIVSCIYDHGGSTLQRFQNHFYEISDKDHTQQSQTSENNYMLFKPFTMKAKRYQTENEYIQKTQTYLVQGVPFDQAYGFAGNSYLNIYRYVGVDSDKIGHLNGNLQPNEPITSNNLKLSKDLVLADFDVLNDWIYVLDYQQGVVIFQYKSNKVIAPRTFFGSAQQTFRYGISVNMLGAKFQMVIAETNYVVEYSSHMVTETPQIALSYIIEDPIEGTVQLQSNQNYFALQQGKLVTIYRRGSVVAAEQKAVFQDVYAFFLWYSNNIQTFVGRYSQIITLKDPSMSIRPTYPVPSDHTITIKAKSTYFGITTDCQISLQSILIDDPTNKDAYKQNYHHDYEWMDSQNFKTSIPLGLEWVGPNINYLEPLPTDESRRRNLLGDVIHDDEGNAIISYNEPQPCDAFDLHDDESENPWFWTEIIAVEGSRYNEFHMIHMDRTYRIVVYFCVPNTTDENDVYCGSPIAEIQVDGLVIALAVGDWGDEKNVLAITTAQKTNIIDFYFLTTTIDHKAGDYWFPKRFNSLDNPSSSITIVDIELADHTLSTVLLDTTYYVSLYYYDANSFIEPGLTITKQDKDLWPIYPNVSSAFTPQKVITSPYHPNVLFIQCVDVLYAINVSGKYPMFLSQIPITAIKTYTFVTERSLVVAKQSLQLSDYQLNDISALSADDEFIYQTYEFEYIPAFAAAQGKYTNLLYVLANTRGKSDLQLLVYRTGVENIRTLVKVLELEADGTGFTLDQDGWTHVSAGGYSSDYILVQYNMKKKWFRAPKEDTLVIEYFPNKKNNKYVDDLEITVEVHPWANNGVNFHLMSNTVQIVNTQTIIIQDEDTISASLGEGLFSKNQDRTFIADNVNEWYYGSVIDMSLSCSPDPKVCQDNFYIQNQVQEQVNPKLENIPKVIDMLNVYDKVYQLAQDPQDPTNYVINQLDRELDLMLPYNTFSSNDDDLECYYMVETKDEKYQLASFVVICWSYKEKMYVAKIVQDYETEEPLDEENNTIYLQTLPENTIKKGEIYWFHSALFINSFGSQSALYIFDITNTAKAAGQDYRVAIELQKITKIKYNYDTVRLNIVSFFPTYEEITLKMGTQKWVKLFIADDPIDMSEDPHIYFINLDTTDSFAPDEESTSRLDYRFFVVNKHKLFANSQTEILRIQLMEFNENVESGSKYLTEYKFIVMTSNTAMYEFLVYFERSQSAINEPYRFDQLISYISNAYNNYGTTIPIPQIQIYNNAMSVAYYDAKERYVYFVIYQLFSVDERRRSLLSEEDEDEDDSHVPLHTFKGGVKKENLLLENAPNANYPAVDFLFYQSRNSQTPPYLLITDVIDKKTLISYDYTPDKIAITTTGTFAKQQVTIKLNSVYASRNDVISTIIDFGYPPDPVDPGHHGGGSDTGLIVGLSVFFGLLLIGGVGFFLWWRKKKMGGSNPFDRKDSTTDGMSLQEPLKA